MNIKIPKFDPIDTFEEDKLGFQNAAVRLHTVLSNIETPNTFGIYGVWGSGKTSLMKITKKIIDDGIDSSKIATVWFDPWKFEYEKDVPIVYPLLFQIQKTLKNPSLKSFLKESGKFLGTLGLTSSTTVIKLLSGGTIDEKVSDISENIDAARNVFYSQYENWAKNLDNFQIEFEKKLNDALKANKLEKLYIFIDDMDRCLPENAIQLLETMKNYLSVKNTLFIIGVDRRVIVNHINHKYGDSSDFGDEYLNKIIPISINVPSKNPLNIVKSILEKLGEQNVLTEDEIELIGSYLELILSNNRRLINTIFYKYLLVLSYVNIHDLLNEIKKVAPNEYKTVYQCRIALLRWILIQEIYPTLFNNVEWPNEYGSILISAPTAPKIVRVVKRIGDGWKQRETDQLAPRIETNVAFILNKFISGGLFE